MFRADCPAPVSQDPPCLTFGVRDRPVTGSDGRTNHDRTRLLAGGCSRDPYSAAEKPPIP